MSESIKEPLTIEQLSKYTTGELISIILQQQDTLKDLRKVNEVISDLLAEYGTTKEHNELYSRATA